ncbi:MAG: hypothetical protein J7L99_00185 [Planctomycetes bacterium]|nr:hypothetical protein [Planctomycetota bacterium]
MRYINILITASLVSIFFVGCSNPQRDAQKKLSKQIDIARRMYNHAITLQANPQYIEKKTGKPSPITHPLSSAEEIKIPTTRRAEDPRVITLLNKAAGILQKAISDYSAAPKSTIADAEFLLGEILFAKAEYYSTLAERIRSNVSSLRQDIDKTLTRARESTILAAFNHALANMPVDKIMDLQKKTEEELSTLEAKKANSIAKKTALEKENEKLSKENEALQNQAMLLRDKSERATGTKGLELLKSAQRIEEKINNNASRIANNLETIKMIDFDMVRLEQALRDVRSKLDAIKERLEEIARGTNRASEAEKSAKETVVKNQQKILSLVQRIIEQSAKLASREKATIDTLKDAQKHLARAQKIIQHKLADERVALLRLSPADRQKFIRSNYEEHLMLIAVYKGTSYLEMAEMYSRQLIFSRNNTQLAKKIKSSWKTFGPGTLKLPEELVDKMGKYISIDNEKIQKEAIDAYKIAEGEFERALELRPTSNVGRNTLWNCQALLANAYLGHFRLSRDKAILTKAMNLINNALKDKESSPYLAPVRELKKLILAYKT